MNSVKRYGHISYLVEACPQMMKLYPSMTVYVLAADFDRVAAERDALQLRLNAADQRNDDLEELLVEAHRSVDYHAGMQREDCGERLYGLLSRISAALKQENIERCHEIPGTSGMRLNMLANQGE